MSPPRLPASVLAALGLTAAAPSCRDEPEVRPCLNVVVPQPVDADPDTGPAAPPDLDGGTEHVGPCLEFVDEPPPPPLPEPVDPPEPPIEPCLSPPAPEPPIEPCLRIAPPRPDRPDAEPKSLPAPGAPEKAEVVRKVLDGGVLPEDVAARLRARRKE